MARESVLKGIATVVWLTAWANHAEESSCTNLIGEDLGDIAPTPSEDDNAALRAYASKLLDATCKYNDAVDADALLASMARACRAADCRECRHLFPRVADAGNHDAEEEYLARWIDANAERFGECLAYAANGDGVSWEDDHASEVAVPDAVASDDSDLDIMTRAERTCGCMCLTVEVHSRDEWIGHEDGTFYSEAAPDRSRQISLDVYARNHAHARYWIARNRSINGSSWETACDLDDGNTCLVYTSVEDRASLVTDLRAEGYSLDLSDYDDEEWTATDASGVRS